MVFPGPQEAPDKDGLPGASGSSGFYGLDGRPREQDPLGKPGNQGVPGALGQNGSLGASDRDGFDGTPGE